MSFGKIISLVAFGAVTIFSVSFALIRDGHTGSIYISEPST